MQIRKICLFLLAVLPLGLSAQVINVKECGAVGDGKTDDTAAIQSAIDKALDKHYSVLIPGGIYLVSQTLKLEKCTGLKIEGSSCGGLRGNPFEPLDKGRWAYSALVWNGVKGGTMIESNGCGGILLQQLMLCGENLPTKNGNRAGKLIWVKSPAGWGNMVNKFSGLTLSCAETGIQFGEKSSDFCASDAVFDFITVRQLNTAFKFVHDQGVDYLVNFIFGLACEKVFHFERGGNIQVNNAQLTDCKMFCQIDGGGRNAGAYLFNNVRLEAMCGGRVNRYQLLKSYPKWKQALIRFINFDDVQHDWVNNKGPDRNMPLCDIGPGTTVVFETSIFNSPVARIKGSTDSDARLIIRNSCFSFCLPKNSVTAEEFGYFKLVDNFKESMQILPDRIKWFTPKPEIIQ